MYMAITVKMDNGNIFTGEAATKELYYSYAQKVSENENIAAKLDMIGGLLHANIYPTKKRACEVVAAWNEAYKRNGTYAFASQF